MKDTINKNLFSFIFFSIILILVIYRGPCFLTEGIFQGDELVFYKNAKKNGILDGLFYFYPGAGYFKLWTNISTTFASLFSFNAAKIITTYFSLISYFIIFFFIYYSNSELFLNLKYKIFAILVVLLSPPMTPEIWMGSAHTREYFGIFSFILLFYDPKFHSNLNIRTSYFLILISGLSSVWAVALTPVYFVKYFYNKNKYNLMSFFSSLIASLTQILIIFYTYLFVHVESSSRFQVELSKIFSFIYNVPVRSFFGSTIPKTLFLNTNLYYHQNFNFIIYVLFLFLIAFIIFYIIKKRDFNLNLILLSFIFVSAFSLIGSLYPNFAGGRYAVLPGVILIFFVLRIFTIEKNKFLKILTGALLIITIFTGLFEFKYKSPLPEVLKCEFYELNK